MRWAIGSSVVSVAIRSVTATVVSRVEPPAPYVIDTNDGRSGSSSRIACQSSRSPGVVLGGKNSNEKVGWRVTDELPDRRLRIGEDRGKTERHDPTLAGDATATQAASPAR